MQPLIELRELKWEYLQAMFALGGAFANVRHDEIANILLIRFIPPEVETVVFYIGKIGLLVEPETMNVVGFHLENVDEATASAIKRYFV